jgi:hypothetical protein
VRTHRSATCVLFLALLASCTPVREQQVASPTEPLEINPTAAPAPETKLRSLLGEDERGEVATSVIELEGGGFLVAGYDYGKSGGIGEWNALVMRISPAGKEIWRRSSQRSGSEYAWVVREAGDGRYVVVGTWESEDGDTDGYMQCINADGDELWFMTYGGGKEEILWAAEPTSDGGFLLAGQTDSEGAGGLDFYVVRTDAHGHELWSKSYGTSVTDRALGLGLGPDGGALIAGFTGAVKSTMDLLFVRIDKDGRELWRRSLGGDRFDVAHDVLALPDGGFAISGYTSSYGPVDNDGFLMRLSPEGRMLWMRTYGDKKDDRILHVVQLDDGGFALIGYSSWNMVVWRLDMNGDLIWTYQDGGRNTSVGKDIIVTEDGAIVAVGGSHELSTTYEDVLLLVLGEQ